VSVQDFKLYIIMRIINWGHDVTFRGHVTSSVT